MLCPRRYAAAAAAAAPLHFLLYMLHAVNTALLVISEKKLFRAAVAAGLCREHVVFVNN